MNIKVKCKNCNWEGKAIVGKIGFKLIQYCCPKCGYDLKRGKGRYDYYGGMAQLINGEQKRNTYREEAKLKSNKL